MIFFKHSIFINSLKRIELFILLSLTVQIIHYASFFLILKLVLFLSKSALWQDLVVQLVYKLFSPFSVNFNNSSELYYAINIEQVIQFILVISCVLVFISFIICYMKIFFFIFRVTSFRRFSIIKTGSFLDELGFVLTWLSICAVYNKIFMSFGDFMFSKTIFYDSLHAFILMCLFSTKSYGISIRRRNKPLKT